MKKNILLKICWLLPLILGITIFIFWIIFRVDFFIIVGIINIYFGFGLALFGIVFGIIQIILNHRKGIKKNRDIVKLLILIVSNFLVAYGFVKLSVSIETAFTVEINNTSDQALYNCIIDGGGINEIIGEIELNQKVQRTFWIKEDGTLNFRYELKGVKKVINIQGYVTNFMGGNEKITISK